jgi:flagellar basal body-associated protein FliL
MKPPVLIGILIVVLILGVLVYSSMNLAKYRVEVCIDFHGMSSCKTASGASKEFAQRSATTNACAGIASGVTDSIACENTPPTKVTWK